MGEPPRRAMRDYEIVDAKALSEVLQEWRHKYLAERPLNARYVTADIDGGVGVFIGAIEWLVGETGMNHKRVSEIVNGKRERVSFRDADTLLTAIGEFHELLPGRRVAVMPNPDLSLEAYLSFKEDRGECV